MKYKVFVEYGSLERGEFTPRGSERGIATFEDVKDAELFIKEKLGQDALFGTTTRYAIHEGHRVVQTFGAGAAQAETKASTQTSSGGQGATSGNTFRPTPFNTAPRPTGMPQKWNVNKDDEEKK